MSLSRRMPWEEYQLTASEALMGAPKRFAWWWAIWSQDPALIWFSNHTNINDGLHLQKSYAIKFQKSNTWSISRTKSFL